MLPASPPASSTTYRLHVPFGLIPLNTLSADPPDGAGAGAGNVSSALMLVGLNVPDTRGPASGRLVAAASSNVKVTPATGVVPPTSDMIIAFCPPGATSSTSTSSGNEWPKPFKVTVKLVIVDAGKATFSVDGYGVAVPEKLIVIDDVLQI
jgi:hypothetical protein